MSTRNLVTIFHVGMTLVSLMGCGKSAERMTTARLPTADGVGIAIHAHGAELPGSPQSSATVVLVTTPKGSKQELRENVTCNEHCARRNLECHSATPRNGPRRRQSGGSENATAPIVYELPECFVLAPPQPAISFCQCGTVGQ